ncbi:FHA domain-containing protein [bacterium]|nr:FHA domain-containing protein [bacterium]
MALRVDDFVVENRDLDEGSFLARFPHPFLVSEGASASASTSNLEARTAKMKGPLPAESAGSGEGPFLLAIKKKEHGQHGSIVTVGRAEDCDVRIAHPLVSKRHAYFTQEGEKWFICDAESSNGTFADGVALDPHKKHLLTDSEALRFGPEVRYRYFGSLAFFRYMSYRARIKK